MGPNRTLDEIKDIANEGGMDIVTEFSEACRVDLGRPGAMTEAESGRAKLRQQCLAVAGRDGRWNPNQATFRKPW